MDQITYRQPGYDPNLPNGNMASHLADHGDGTGTLTTYNDDGTSSTETVTGLDVETVDVDPLAIFDAGTAGTLTMTKLKNAYRAALVALTS